MAEDLKVVAVYKSYDDVEGEGIYTDDIEIDEVNKTFTAHFHFPKIKPFEK